MSGKHKLIFEFIKAYMKIHGVAPSYSVIARGIGLKSKSNVHRVIHVLQDQGLLTIKPHKCNSIRIVKKTEDLGL
jgi:SOS-response transcriptional repressor LexA